mmetsp:Transcript_10249/g.27114  ORF Transcript_10249/g.27114 Transcript_10249/m.27114 type:complete len:211 (-) Transcript_10249:875-1507(-)
MHGACLHLVRAVVGASTCLKRCTHRKAASRRSNALINALLHQRRTRAHLLHHLEELGCVGAGVLGDLVLEHARQETVAPRQRLVPGRLHPLAQLHAAAAGEGRELVAELDVEPVAVHDALRQAPLMEHHLLVVVTPKPRHSRSLDLRRDLYKLPGNVRHVRNRHDVAHAHAPGLDIGLGGERSPLGAPHAVGVGGLFVKVLEEAAAAVLH